MDIEITKYKISLLSKNPNPKNFLLKITNKKIINDVIKEKIIWLVCITEIYFSLNFPFNFVLILNKGLVIIACCIVLVEIIIIHIAENNPNASNPINLIIKNVVRKFPALTTD